MTDTTAPSGQADTEPTIRAIEERQNRVGQLLAGLQESAPSADPRAQADSPYENQLAIARLGMATSLFFALRTKHAPTASHSLRVAIICSAWAERLGLEDDVRDRIEIAALLHDIGKMGIPDRILRKPGRLSADEQLSMDCCPQLGVEVLRGCTDDNELLQIVQYANSWFDSRRESEGPRGDALPLGARMLAIANAFDAMTTDTVYRAAMSRERAVNELIQGSSTQFDPDLVMDFSRMLDDRPELLQGVAAARWLNRLQGDRGESIWNATLPPANDRSLVVRRETLFHQQLLSNLKDGVVFTDGEGNITQWNPGMQQLTGIAADAIVGQAWSDECIRLRNADDTRDDTCMVEECLTSGSLVARPMLIEQLGGDPTPVHVHVSPVIGSTPGVHGAVVIIRDYSDQSDLEQQLESLHHKTTLDPLTGVANRAFFDDCLNELMAISASGGPSFSLIMCDIDHFKRVNDVHGHPAGDEALVSFASILTSHSREGDLVARYGGEEFLLLTPNCDNATASKRAESIRKALETTPLPSIGNEAVTASFGVTELQSGDTSESLVARADRALLKAKDNGRNRVIQLGAGGQVNVSTDESKKGWRRWFGGDERPCQGEFDIVTPVPVDIAIEKLRGFIADHNAEIISVQENEVSMKLNALCVPRGRRRVDARIAVQAKLTLSELPVDQENPLAPSHTNVHVALQPVRNRDRRDSELSERYRQVVFSFKSYLMGEIQD